MYSTLLQFYHSRIGLLGSIFRLQNKWDQLRQEFTKQNISENGRHISKIIFPSKLHMFIGRWGWDECSAYMAGAILLFDEVWIQRLHSTTWLCNFWLRGPLNTSDFYFYLGRVYPFWKACLSMLHIKNFST